MPPGTACLDFIEFRMLLTKCADMINSRPIGVLLAEDDLQPLTPNHLLIDRTSSGQVSQESLNYGDKYCKRLKYVNKLSNQWWNVWIMRVFPSLLPFKSRTRKQRNLEVNDIVLDQTKVKLGKDSYRMANVVKLIQMSLV